MNFDSLKLFGFFELPVNTPAVLPLAAHPTLCVLSHSPSARSLRQRSIVLGIIDSAMTAFLRLTAEVSLREYRQLYPTVS